MRVIFTNGCFDVLTVAHVQLLEFCHALKQTDDRLLVGLNSDESVRYLKGPPRPIFNKLQRSQMLTAIKWVDEVVYFNEPTVIHMLQLYKPRLWVKGGDYTMDTLNKEEVNIAKQLGCEIRLAPKFSGPSSSDIIERLREAEATK